ncbi:MarR family winged helix-turn-helix transcriptional regulator, partial [Staphylococcus lugdunensis]|uniref:MarR family winged helix-turn-helix transcriptional regulator n=2 Tax=Staphylococcus TaxID=1279 RepID=UPI0030C3BF1A
TYTGYIVLMAIEEDEKLNIKTLGDRVFLDSGTLTPLLKKLEKKNYVVRTREEKDERNLQISLTDHGKSIKKPLSEVSVKV